jgi:MFS family permease
MSHVVAAEPVNVSQPGAAKVEGRWRALIAMAFASVSDGLEGGLINTLFPVIRAALNLDLGALGLLSSISRFSRMLFGPLWSIAADRFGRKKVLIFVTGVWGLWTAAAGLAQNFTQLLILYGIGVIGTVAAEPIANGLLADIFPEEERGRAYGFIRFISAGGGVLLTPFIGRLANIEDGWRIGMYIMGGLSVLSGILILFFVHEPKYKIATADSDAGKFQWSKVGELVRTPTILLLAGMLPFVTSLVLFSFFVTYYVDVRGWDTAQAAILFSVFMAGFAISSFVGGVVGDWFDKRFGPKGRIMLMQIYLVGFAILSFLAMQVDWGHGSTIYAVLFLFGLWGSIGFSGVVLPMVSAVVPVEVSATAFALLFSLVQGFLSAVITLSVGYIAERIGLENVMLYMVTIPYAINAVYWTLFYKYYPRDVAKQQARLAKLTGLSDEMGEADYPLQSS